MIRIFTSLMLIASLASCSSIARNITGVNAVPSTEIRPVTGQTVVHEDVILQGEVVLISDGGEQILRAGDTAGFPAGVVDGHHLVNKGSEEAVYIEIGSRVTGDVVDYPDIDLVYLKEAGIFTNKRGESY